MYYEQKNVIYFLNISGYYENKMHLKTVYTKEKMQEFEEDVKNGVNLDLENFIRKIFSEDFKLDSRLNILQGDGFVSPLLMYRMFGQKSLVFGKPVVWNGRLWEEKL